ncbi:YgdI/YgdR family lipoprotein [Pseudodesulfovibrio indicus]|uniref:YgdI/YgdR family lipoprotein n=1 Tax=Pseudodesulfovibrio indicus TaxID=1716143 RepID=UPI00292FE0A0|nr:YgdI/YgdR family lipoprotein [Pseudodesulfovibrio indicus]
MKNLLRPLVLTALTLALAACMSSYRITTTDGQVYIADETPVYDVATDSYAFTAQDGQQVRLSKQQIELIKEQ